jgi:hypothetical protein
MEPGELASSLLGAPRVGWEIEHALIDLQS